MEQHPDITTYFRILKRRKWLFILPIVGVMIVAAIVAFALPPVYRSEATLLVESQEIPEDIVQSSVTGYVEERIQAISQVVLSRPNLIELINRFNLYPGERKRRTTEEITTAMREDISISPVQTEVTDPKSGRTGTATIAFTLSYEGREPRKVAQVANTLVSLFLEESAKKREEKAQTTVRFLEEQLQDLNQEIDVIEENIAQFKDQHQLSLPELMQWNLQMIQRVEDRMDQTEEELNKLQDRKIYLRGQLATLEPYKNAVNAEGKLTASPQEQLKQLRNRYLTLKSSKSEKHPDVIQLRKQVEALEQQVSARHKLRNLHKDLESVSVELARLRKRYSEKHPDVIKAVKKKKELKEQIADLSVDQGVPNEEAVEPDSPAYINLQTQIESTQMEIQAARKDLQRMRSKYAELQRRIEKTPKVEQAYTELQRNYENAKAKYQETKSRLLSAREAQDLEQNQISQKLTLVDPPTVPEEPYKPNRMALLLVGAVLSLGCGVGSGSLGEFMDTSMHTPRDLSALTSRPLLAAIPNIQTHRERRRRRMKVLLTVLGVLAGTLVLLWLVHTFIRPLDVIWIQIMRKVQLLL